VPGSSTIKLSKFGYRSERILGKFRINNTQDLPHKDSSIFGLHVRKRTVKFLGFLLSVGDILELAV
jgi:hypothetical protein